jgi:cilia- and flagella-associated protein 57
MSGSKLQVKHVFGLTQNSRNSLAFAADHTLVYNSGAYVVVLNTESKEQGLICTYGSHVNNNKSQGCTAITTSHPRKFIAVAECGEHSGIVALYDSSSLRKKKVLHYPDIGSKFYNCIAFSDDGRQCLTQGGGPEWNLLLWSIEKTCKVLAMTKLVPNEDMVVNQISFCPWDSTLAIAVGKGFIKLIRILDGAFKITNIGVRRENANFISHCWLPDDILIVGTEQGEILLIESNEYRGVIYPSSMPGGSTIGNDNGFGPEELAPVYCFCPSSRGFCAGTVDGEVRMFERSSETRELYALVDKQFLPGQQGKVLNMVLGSDDTLVAASDMQQLYAINLSSLHQSKGSDDEKDKVVFEPLSSSFHAPNVRGEATITGIDIALWRQVVATTGKDRTIRLWNMSEKRQEAVHVFEEEPTSMALHPSGLYAAISFLEKVQILSLLLDGFAHCRDLNIRSVNLLRFSRGGQFIACCAGTVIQIYHTYTGVLHCTLRGHTNRIKSLVWGHLDSTLMSVGAEGATFFWDLVPVPKKSTEKHHTLLTPFTCGVSPADGSVAYLATSDKVVREVPFLKQVDPATGLEGEVREARDVEVGKSLSQLIYDESRKLIVGASAEDEQPGHLLTAQASPQLSTSIEWTLVHDSPINVMCQSFDKTQVYSADVNGSLVISEFEGSTGLGNKKHEGVSSFEFAAEVSIKSTTLSSKKKIIADLILKVDELTKNNEHQLRLKEMDFNDRSGDITKKFDLQLSQESEKYLALTNERLSDENDRTNRLSILAEKHSTELRNIEKRYKTKLHAEGTRYKNLLGEVENTHRRWNEENAALVNSHQAYLKELCYEYEEKLSNEHSEQKRLLEEKSQIQTVAEGNRDWVEDDGEQEVTEVKSRFELRLRNEENLAVDLMAQHALVRKQLQNLGKDTDVQRDEIKRLRERELRLNETIRSLEKDIQSHKKEIREREETITDKEKRIFDLKKKNQELEKFRFVLDYKIRELKLQIAPREQETAALRRQSEEMALELDQYHKSGLALELMLNELRLKADGLRKELKKQEDRENANNNLLEKFRRDLRETWEISNDPNAFKNRVVKLYRMYVQEDISGAGGGGSDGSDPQEIYNRDREQLERSLESLRRALKTDATAHKRDLGKMMREAVLLTGELNTLRKDARYLELQKRTIVRCGGVNPKNIKALMSGLNLDTKKSDRELEKEANERAANADMMPGAPDGTGGPQPPNAGKVGFTAPIGKGGVRSAALRTTVADGGLARAPTLAPATGTDSDAAAGGAINAVRNGGDQWGAWKEIQMQNVTMNQLEEQLNNECQLLGIDALHILVSIDSNLTNSGL